MKNPFLRISVFCLSATLAVFSGVGVSSGQGRALEQIDQTRRARDADRLAAMAAGEAGEAGERAPELYEGESSDVGPQFVLSIEPQPWFEFVADSQIYHTGNVFLTDGNEHDAAVLVHTLQLALAPPPFELGAGRLEPRLGVRQQWYQFGVLGPERGGNLDLDLFDFESQSAFIDGRYHFCDGWIATLGFEAARLIDDKNERQLYREYAPHWGLQKRCELGASSLLFLGYEGLYRGSEDESPVPAAFRLTDRMDHSLFGVLSVPFGERLVAQATCRYRYTSFFGSQRADHLHSIGLGLHYFFTPRLSVRTYLSYDIRNTGDSPVPDYDRFNAGGGVNLTLSF